MSYSSRLLTKKMKAGVITEIWGSAELQFVENDPGCRQTLKGASPELLQKNDMAGSPYKRVPITDLRCTR